MIADLLGSDLLGAQGCPCKALPSFAGTSRSVALVERVTVPEYSSKRIPAKGKFRRTSSRSGWAPASEPALP